MKHVPNHDKVLFKDMTPEERSVIVEAWIDGKAEIEVSDGQWYECDESLLLATAPYRTKPKQLVIPWGHIKPEYKWAAMDADGLLFFYEKLPVSCLEDAMWDSAGFTCRSPLKIDTDGIYWKDSLMQRPKGV